MRILVVDDEAGARRALETLLKQVGHTVDTAKDGAEGLAIALERAPELVVTDLDMPELNGLVLVQKLHEIDPELPIVVVTAAEGVGSAVAAMRSGAADYLTKPIDFDALLFSIDRVTERRSLRVEAENLRRQLREKTEEGLQGLVGSSPAMQKVYRTARRVAGSKATVLVTGESGTGKGELARAIHALSPRAKMPFVGLHCAAIPETLLESEMFGHERGAFTGADKRRIGRFEQAIGGTIFLDEIGEISPLVQTKLLRVLQERAVERLGGSETIPVDVRVIAATNKDLPTEVREGRFREDLFYRLNVVHLEMPPLRLRGSDVLVLALAFLRRFASDNQKPVDELTPEARDKIMSHRWPGNVRELENAMERAVVLTEGTKIEAEDLPFEMADVTKGAAIRVPGATMREIERWAILATLEATQGSTSKAADILDIGTRTIQYRLNEYGLSGRDKPGL